MTAASATRKPFAASRSRDGEHALVLERGRDHGVEPVDAARGAGAALHREVVGLGATGREHDLGRVGAEQRSATVSRASSSAVFAARAAECAPDGLPGCSARNGSIAATASGRIGVLAA